MNLGDLKATLSIDEGSINAATANVKKALQKAGTDSGKAMDDGITQGAKKWIGNAVEEAKSWTKKMKSSFDQLKDYLKNVLGIAAVYEFGKAVFGLTSQMEQLKGSFETLLGSGEKAAKMLADIDSFARQTPFSKLDVAANAQKLLGFGFAAEQILPTLQSVGNAVAAIGGNKETLDGVILALGQIQTKGKISAEEMNQLAERGIPAWRLLSEQLGKTTAETMKLAEQGKIAAGVAVPAILRAFQEQYLGALDKQSKTLQGRFSNLVDGIQTDLAKFGTANIEFFGGIVDGAGTMFSGLGKQLLAVIGDVLAAISIVTTYTQSAWAEVTNQTKSEASKQIGFWDALWFGVRTVWTIVTVKLAQLFMNVYEGVKTGTANMGVFFSNLGKNAEVLGGKIGASLVSAFNKSIDAIGWFSKSFAAGINDMTAKIANFTGIDSLRSKFDGIDLSWFKIQASAASWSFVDMTAGMKEFAFVTDEVSAKTIDWKLTQAAATKEMEKSSGQTAYNLNTLDGLGKSINQARKQLGGLTVGSAEYLQKQKEIAAMEKQLSDAMGFGNTPASAPPAPKSGKASKAETEEQARAVNKLKDSYSDLKSKIKESQKAAEEYSTATQKLNRDIADSLREVGKQMDENEKKRSDALAKAAEDAKTKRTDSTGDYLRDQAVKQVELAKDVAEIQADIEQRRQDAAKKSESYRADLLEKQKKIQDDITVAELRRSEFTSATSEATRKENEYRLASLRSQLAEIKNGSELTETDKTLLDLQEKLLEKQRALADVKSNLKNVTETEAGNADALKTKVAEILDVETKRAAMSEQKRAEFDFQQKLAQIDQEKAKKDAEAEADFQREKTKLERQAKIYEFFQKNKDLTARQLKLIQDGEDFKTASKEEQDLILKLGRERMETTTKKNEKIAAEREVADATTTLSNQVTETLRANVKSLKAEYSDLISEIRAAIDAQRSLSGTGAGAAKRGFSSGGYTGDGAISEVAGIVHRGEYVVPNHVLQGIPSLIPQLEAVRSGRVDNSRNVSITGPITVNREMDFQLLLERAKFRM